jgi:hypothetical protein
MKVIPKEYRTARDYHCPSPENKQTADSGLSRVALLTVMSLAGGYPTHPADKLN